MRIAIIGAGIAGLACAQRLSDSAIDVRLFDKARGPGGRLATRRGDAWQADIGAQYFTAREPAFRAAVGAWAEAGVIARWNVEPVRLGRASPAVSANAVERWVGVPRMSALTRHLAAGLDVESGRRIEAIEGGPGWYLRDHEGATHGPFDAVVSAVPAPQAATLLRPAAPALAEEAAAVAMQGCWAGVLTVDGERPAFDAAFVTDHPLRWIARDGSKPGRDGSATWVAHADPDWSDQRLEWTPEAALPVLASLFADATGLPANAVRGLAAHKWRYSRSREPHRAGFLFDPRLALGACGDWCNGDRVEGAWLSGDQLASRILATVGS